jgi:MFS transporter, FHS family, L-fucose permease
MIRKLGNGDRPPQEDMLLYMVYFIYFFCGLAQCFETVFIPEFKEFFNLDYQQAMYVNTGKNAALVFSVLIGFLSRRLGFKNCLIIAMLLYAAGTFMIIAGLSSASYAWVIAAFSVVGLGFSFQLVAGNPMLSELGPADGASSRLNLGNALGAVAWIVSPLLIAALIPETVSDPGAKIHTMKTMFGIIAGVLASTAILTLLVKDIKPGAGKKMAAQKGMALRKVWLNPRVILGFVVIFLVLGMEAGIFSLIQNYTQEKTIIGLDAQKAKLFFTVFFALFALGRIVASWLQKRISPALHLAVNAAIAILLVLVIVSARGVPALAAITLIGFFISPFFPTLYAMTIRGMGEYTGQVSGLLTMGFLGCAVIPVLQGHLADITGFGLQKSFVIGIVPYLFVLFYALKGTGLKEK